MQKPLLTIETCTPASRARRSSAAWTSPSAQGETHVLMGPNGTGKSTLGCAITGSPAYTVTAGRILFDGEDITQLPVNERARRGIFSVLPEPAGGPRRHPQRLHPHGAGAEDRQPPAPVGLQEKS